MVKQHRYYELLRYVNCDLERRSSEPFQLKSGIALKRTCDTFIKVESDFANVILMERAGRNDPEQEKAYLRARQPGLPLAVRHGGCRCVCDMMIDRVTPLGGAAAQSHRAVRGAWWSGPMTRSDSALAGAGRDW